jgi:hypothetical protein
VLTDADGDEAGIVVDPHGHLVTRLAGSDGSGHEQQVAVTSGGAIVAWTSAIGLPKNPCNAVRRTNCAPKGY